MDQGTITTIIYVVVFGAMIFFLFIRPQKKREKEAKAMIAALVVGSKIVTIGGVVGTVVHVGDDEVTIETSVEKTQLVFLKSAISTIREKPADTVLETK
ncbi:MAG: preprotein translocase subunit YajC [Clostridia bacterium]